MSETIQFHILARIHTDFPTKFGVPRQSGLVDTPATILFEPAYRNPDALRGLEYYSHLWLLWQFSNVPEGKNWSPTVRPPRLGGNTRVGVFASRSPFRPNPIGLSSVKLERIELGGKDGPTIHILGADLVNNTPIFDIKPYLPYTDSHPDAASGFTASCDKPPLQVDFPPTLLEQIPAAQRPTLLAVLEQDPRPAYHDDPNRLYGMPFAKYDICFTVADGRLTVRDVRPFLSPGK